MAKKFSKDIRLLGRRIDDLRQQNNWTMREFASKCKISKTQVNELSNKGVDFRYSSLCKIAGGLEITIQELLNF
jgi:transcriptional regulator with XRE-family HTH domain